MTPARYSINKEIRIINSEFRDGLTVMKTNKKKKFKFEGKLQPDDEKFSSSSEEEYGIEDDY